MAKKKDDKKKGAEKKTRATKKKSGKKSKTAKKVAPASVGVSAQQDSVATQAVEDVADLEYFEDLRDSYDEDADREFIEKPRGSIAETQTPPKYDGKFYDKELQRLQIELVKLQEWIRRQGLKVIALFEGRDAAGKGGVIKRIMAKLNPRVVRVVALGTPSDREKTQWYFQRYVPHLPAAGEIVLFDRSWYNRAGVERVMGFCTDEQYEEFMKTVIPFELMLKRSGIILIKYWFSISDKEQEKRFQLRIQDPAKRWKLSPMDLKSRAKWEDYTKAKDTMFERTDVPESPWYIVKADDKKRARLNCISHLLSMIPYDDVTSLEIELPKRQYHTGYKRRPVPKDRIVPERY